MIGQAALHISHGPVQIAACHLGKQGQNNADDCSPAILPFVLIQGPPGTMFWLPAPPSATPS